MVTIECLTIVSVILKCTLIKLVKTNKSNEYFKLESRIRFLGEEEIRDKKNGTPDLRFSSSITTGCFFSPVSSWERTTNLTTAVSHSTH